MFNLFHFGGFADARQANQQVKAGNAILLDVRTPAEFSAGHAVGARNLPLEQLASKPQLEADKPIYLYCNSGNRSGHAKTILTRMGFAQVENIGGLRDWQAAGGPLEYPM